MPQCSHRRKDGRRCRANALPGKAACTFHEPALSAKRAAGRKLGGRVRSKAAAVLSPRTPDLPLATVSDVVILLAATINQARRGELAAKVANCIGVLSGVMLKALEQGDVEMRLARLEAQSEQN